MTLSACALVFGCTDGGGVQQCEDLCARTPAASSSEGACTSSVIEDLGYNTDHPDCQALAAAFAQGSATRSMCSACYDSIGVSGSDCRSAEVACFGGGGGGGGGADASLPLPDAGGGQPDAPAAVTTCDQLCALTPTATSQEGQCSGMSVVGLGYDTDNIPCNILSVNFNLGTATAAECTACYDAINITDADCTAVHGMCF